MCDSIWFQVCENVTVVDPTLEEEQCGPVSAVVGVAPCGTVCSVHLPGPGTIAPHTLRSVIKVGGISTY